MAPSSLGLSFRWQETAIRSLLSFLFFRPRHPSPLALPSRGQPWPSQQPSAGLALGCEHPFSPGRLRTGFRVRCRLASAEQKGMTTSPDTPAVIRQRHRAQPAFVTTGARCSLASSSTMASNTLSALVLSKHLVASLHE